MFSSQQACWLREVTEATSLTFASATPSATYPRLQHELWNPLERQQGPETGRLKSTGETAEFPWGDCDIGGGVLTPSEGGNWEISFSSQRAHSPLCQQG